MKFEYKKVTIITDKDEKQIQEFLASLDSEKNTSISQWKESKV
jgi:hypothetical protein